MNQHKTIVYCFCGCFVVTLLIFVGYLWNSSVALKSSQEKIINGHIKHIANVDSIFYDVKTVILSNDSGTIVNAPIFIGSITE